MWRQTDQRGNRKKGMTSKTPDTATKSEALPKKPHRPTGGAGPHLPAPEGRKAELAGSIWPETGNSRRPKERRKVTKRP